METASAHVPVEVPVLHVTKPRPKRATHTRLEASSPFYGTSALDLNTTAKMTKRTKSKFCALNPLDLHN